MNTEKYIGLTIGPIYQTLQQVKSTRALFAGSYFFSYVMKTLIAKLEINPAQMLTPATPEAITVFGEHPEVGLFPDRMILKAETDTFQKLINAREEVLDELSKQLSADLGMERHDPMRNYLNDYLKIYFFEVELEKNEHTIHTINRHLDSLELHPNFPQDQPDFLFQFLNKRKNNFLIADAFKTQNRFPSLIEISTRELQEASNEKYRSIIKQYIWDNQKTKNTDTQEDEDVVRAFKNEKTIAPHFKAYHKYIAIVNADGDSIGKCIEAMQGDEQQLTAFSEKMLAFGLDAKLTIDKYGGQAVYIGGDDLLFFAPVANRVNEQKETSYQTIFHLIDSLDKDFQKHFNQLRPMPTLSFGFSLTYYKYPMNEALAVSNQQIYKAKDKSTFQHKNAVAFQIIKHSGQAFSGSFYKSGAPQSSYRLFLKLLDTRVEKEGFINSLTYVLDFHRHTLNHLSTMPDGQERLNFFFANNFDEAIHKKHRPFLKELSILMWQLYQEFPVAKYDQIGEQAMDRLYTILRFIHFLRSADHE